MSNNVLLQKLLDTVEATAVEGDAPVADEAFVAAAFSSSLLRATRRTSRSRCVAGRARGDRTLEGPCELEARPRRPDRPRNESAAL
jgi:hypothetical protein